MWDALLHGICALGGGRQHGPRRVLTLNQMITLSEIDDLKPTSRTTSIRLVPKRVRLVVGAACSLLVGCLVYVALLLFLLFLSTASGMQLVIGVAVLAPFYWFGWVLLKSLAQDYVLTHVNHDDPLWRRGQQLVASAMTPKFVGIVVPRQPREPTDTTIAGMVFLEEWDTPYGPLGDQQPTRWDTSEIEELIIVRPFLVVSDTEVALVTSRWLSGALPTEYPPGRCHSLRVHDGDRVVLLGNHRIATVSTDELISRFPAERLSSLVALDSPTIKLRLYGQW